MSFIGTLPDSPATPVAAFAVAPPIERHTPPGLALALHVQPAVRDRGIERQIVAFAERMSASSQSGPLHAWPHPAAGSEAVQRLEALGFRTFDEVTTWRVLTRQALTRLAKIGAHTEGVIPPGVRVAPLHEADPRDVLALWETELADQGALREQTLRRLGVNAAEGGMHEASRVLLVDGVLRGILLVQSRNPTLAEVAALVLDPQFRMGWAFTHLLTRSLQDAHPGERDAFQFSAMRRHVPTHQLAKVLGAGVVSKQCLIMRPPGAI